jgi:glutamate-ammonia-ligase adenylyltransferase
MKLVDGFERLRIQTLSKRIDPSTLAVEVRKMRIRLQTELGKKARGGVNIKLSEGGIVDIEFLIQYLQLLHGPDNPELFIPYYPESLARMADESLIPGGADVVETYAFYRKLESRMRVTTGQPDSVLPEDPSKLERLAQRMGYWTGSGEKLIKEYKERSELVREIFDRAIPGED